MKLEYLREFLALVESKNYALAAERVFVSTSTLSRHIVALEKELGTPLFYREPHGVRLTAAGERLLPYARQLTELSGEMQRAVRAQSHTITVGFIDALRQYGLLDELFRFRQENSDVTLLFTENNSSALWKMVADQECSFAFCYGRPAGEDESLFTLPLLRDVLAVVLPRFHPLAAAHHATARQLKDKPFIFPHRNSNTWRIYHQLLRQEQLEPQAPLFAGQSTLPMVANGLGFTLVEKRRYGQTLPEELTMIDLIPAVEKQLLLVGKKHTLSPAEQRFLDFVKANFPER